MPRVAKQAEGFKKDNSRGPDDGKKINRGGFRKRKKDVN